MYEHLLNFLRETPELLKESEGPSIIKREGHKLSKQGELFPKLKGRHHCAYERQDSAVRVLTVIFVNLS